ncbi:MAG TPA: stage II sporulation protein D, partial [Clostridia bacterium]|nr:stage II sporulation protein D [Clostridia bacterium]
MRGFFFGIIFLILAILLMPMFIIRSCDISIPGRDMSSRQTIESDLIINVFNHNTKKNMQLGLEDYIIGVVAAEAP